MDPEEEPSVPDDETIIVVLDDACLEVGKSKGLVAHSFLFSLFKLLSDGNFKLLDCDQTALLRKNHLNPGDYRPDIVHMVSSKLYSVISLSFSVC